VPIAGSEFEIEADRVILATGQFPDCGWIGGSLSAQLVGADRWLSSGDAHQTAHPKLFAAGDFALGASTLIQAIGHAKECAVQVHCFLNGGAHGAAAIGPAFNPNPRTGGPPAAPLT
jgi:NADPH-dependent glutamate synthase beta subunit-like oxidoreductase